MQWATSANKKLAGAFVLGLLVGIWFWPDGDKHPDNGKRPDSKGQPHAAKPAPTPAPVPRRAEPPTRPATTNPWQGPAEPPANFGPAPVAPGTGQWDYGGGLRPTWQDPQAQQQPWAMGGIPGYPAASPGYSPYGYPNAGDSRAPIWTPGYKFRPPEGGSPPSGGHAVGQPPTRDSQPAPYTSPTPALPPYN
jgi:hypothetical protein